MSSIVSWVEHGFKRRWLDPNRRTATLLILLLVGLGTLAALYLMVVSHISAIGRRIEGLQAELTDLQQANAGIELEIADETSFPRLKTRADELGFEPAKEILYLPLRERGE